MAEESIVEGLPLARIQIGVLAESKPDIIRELLEGLKREEVIRDVDSALAEFLERESKGSTGIGNGIAIPHVRSTQVSKLEFYFANSKEGVDFESLDGEPIHLLFMMLAPLSSQGSHIKARARVSRALNDETVRARLKDATAPEEVRGILAEREEEIA
jgi:PTS system fructose-specific IIC component